MLDHKTDVMPALDLPITEEANRSYTLPSSWYVDPAIYEREKEAIFYRTWQYVAHKSMFYEPGDYVTVKICDQNIFVIMGKDRELRAFYNVCRHRAHELLSEPYGNVKSVIVCPYHAWSFEREGQLRGARFSNERPGFDKKEFGLKQIRLEMFLDAVFVNLDDNAETLASMAGELEADIRARVPFLDDLRVVGGDTNLLGDTHQAAGWKVVVDNYVECYHCHHAHPDFASLICMEKYEVDCGKYWSRQLGSDIRAKNTAYDVDLSQGFPTSAFWYLWPNTSFNILPGQNEMSIFSIRPVDATNSSFEGHVLSTSGALNRERASYTANVLAPEDIALCESVQRGLMSKGYSQGPIIVGDAASGQGEQGIHHFHRLVHEAMA
ncbi:Rieske 2Fe-2S domain-containing protein [Rhodobacteraceae bacterium NNCM2]|nr:Rieske 2Fe-2S domain-containing protein [Coraliihabitans acroporae]